MLSTIGVDIGFGSSNTAVVATGISPRTGKDKGRLYSRVATRRPTSHCQPHIPTLLTIRNREHFHIRGWEQSCFCEFVKGGV